MVSFEHKSLERISSQETVFSLIIISYHSVPENDLKALLTRRL